MFKWWLLLYSCTWTHTGTHTHKATSLNVINVTSEITIHTKPFQRNGNSLETVCRWRDLLGIFLLCSSSCCWGITHFGLSINGQMNGPTCAEGTGVVLSLSVKEWTALGKWEAKVSKVWGWKQGKRGCIYLWTSSWWYMIKAVKDTLLL